MNDVARPPQDAHGGARVADVLVRHGVRFVYTLCGGHISPILVGAKARGIRVIDVRDEKNAVFAADATARMTGTVGVAAVTAGPGVTNTITAIKNAEMAQSPILLLGGATPTVLKGRGALQDIDQIALLEPIVKWATAVRRLADLVPTLEKAIALAKEGVPGPVFVEIPVDLLYAESTVREWYMKEAGAGKAKGIGPKALELYLRAHLYRQFHAPHIDVELPKLPRVSVASIEMAAKGGLDAVIEKATALLLGAKQPVLVLGSQTLAGVAEPARLAAAVEALGVPTYLGGMARGLLGRHSPVQLRHNRGKALKEADVVVIAGFPFDFRLGYGRAIGRKAKIISANLSPVELRKNRRPELSVLAHPATFLERVAAAVGDTGGGDRWQGWYDTLRKREAERDLEIEKQARASHGGSGKALVNPLQFFSRLEEHMDDDAALVVDGGDFVATASYILRPRAPLSWLDPGVFGTLGVGGGFAVGAALCRPGRELWLIYGDGSCAYSVAEFDTFVRHGLAPIAVVGTDGSWAQIAREQIEILGDDVGTVLRRTAYHEVAQGYGGVGLLLDDPARIDAVLTQAKAIARSGKPVLVNVHLAQTDFRKGSISM
jgi:acetolactate synthase-1/2/3 large subunit